MAAITPSLSINYCNFESCSNEAPKKCAKCKIVFYCGAECQRKDWGIHKLTCQPKGALKDKAEIQAAKILIPKQDINSVDLLEEAIKFSHKSTIIGFFGLKNLERIFTQYLAGQNCYSIGSGDGQLELIAKLRWQIKMIGVDPNGLEWKQKPKFFLEPEFSDFTKIDLEQIPERSNMLIPWPFNSLYCQSDYDLKAITHGAKKLQTIVVIIERSSSSGGDQLLHWINSLHPESAIKLHALAKGPNRAVWPQESFGIKHRFKLQAPINATNQWLESINPQLKKAYEAVVIVKDFKGNPEITEIKRD